MSRPGRSKHTCYTPSVASKTNLFAAPLGIIAALISGRASVINWLLGPEPNGAPGHVGPRWLFLRVLGLIYFSAFYSLLFQIRGLIGPRGILPAGEYLRVVAQHLGSERFWYAPTLLWLGSGMHAMELLVWSGLVASALLTLNLWPRGMLVVCFLAFLSFVTAARDFSEYQSDGMLLCAGFVSFFFAPLGLRPGWGEARPPSRASLFLLQWLWFQIYFESGLAKFRGDLAWRHLIAMDQYYQNGPLPTWISWYVQRLPHRFHAATTFLTLVLELGVVWMLFLPRRFRIICFFIVTPWEIGIILTANYCFLNYLVLALGFLLLDDRFFDGLLHLRWRIGARKAASAKPSVELPDAPDAWRGENKTEGRLSDCIARLRRTASVVGLALSGFFLAWIFYAATALMVWMLVPGFPLLEWPVRVLQPFRIANRYGLFGRMTWARAEIEFQGRRDGQSWIPYPFLYKPQDPTKPPGIYAPYQPRFEWNLWFASLGQWREYPFVLRTQELLLVNDADVLSLFAANPFADGPPLEVRAVIWQYWFSDAATKRAQGLWWRRQLLGLYSPTLQREPNGEIVVVELPELTHIAPEP